MRSSTQASKLEGAPHVGARGPEDGVRRQRRPQRPNTPASGCFPHSSPQRGAELVPALISAAVPHGPCPDCTEGLDQITARPGHGPGSAADLTAHSSEHCALFAGSLTGNTRSCAGQTPIHSLIHPTKAVRASVRLRHFSFLQQKEA